VWLLTRSGVGLHDDNNLAYYCHGFALHQLTPERHFLFHSLLVDIQSIVSGKNGVDLLAAQCPTNIWLFFDDQGEQCVQYISDMDFTAQIVSLFKPERPNLPKSRMI
jgi:hypothetical protein